MPLIGTLTSGVAAMRSFTKNLEVIGNNIANVNTVGFKGSKVNFQDSFSNTLRNSSPSSGASSGNVSAMQVGTGVQIGEISTNFTQGSMSSTGVGTDLAISGAGYFVVENPASGNYYVTRAGNFHWDDQNYLVNDQGLRVIGWNKTSGAQTQIQRTMTNGTAALSSVSFGRDGTLTQVYSDSTQTANVQLIMADFKDPSALVKEGNNLMTGFSAAGFKNNSTTPITSITQLTGNTSTTTGNATPNAGGLGFLQTGALELANVDLTEQFSDMITVQRSFQASSRLVSVSDQILEDIVNLKR